jgi:Ca2+-binding RTX toxin-like protein
MDPTIIEHPDKIGVGTWQVSGQEAMFADLGLIHANWFYTWAPTLLDEWFDDWTLGNAFSIGGTDGDLELVLGSGGDAWAVQNVSVAGGQQLTLSFAAAALNGATGGVTVEFSDASGGVLGSNYLEIAGGDADYRLSVVAPDGTATGRVIAWTGSGSGIEIDDLSLRDTDVELISNGGFENIGSLASQPIADDFVPMIWGAADMKYVRTPGYLDGADTLLTFNEPDHDGQSNMSVSRALSYWPELMAMGLRLGSPAATTSSTLGQGSWLQSFMSQADANGYRVDFIAVHYYATDPSITKFRHFLEDVYAAYHRPVWVTEWALADWDHPDRFTAAQQMEFFKAGTLMMDDLAFVERQAWFGTYEQLGASELNSQLIDANGALSDIGTLYASLAHVDKLVAPKDLLLSNGVVAENAVNGTSVGVVLTVDPEANDGLVYQLVDNAGGRFAIDAVSGKVTVLDGSLLDYEQAQSHDITIRVTDTAGGTLDKSVTIFIADMLEAQRYDGTPGSDVFIAAKADDWTVNGYAGDDSITTLGGADTIRGGAGNDVIVAGDGNDTIKMCGPGDGFDAIDGGVGDDTIVALANGTVIGLTSIAGIETIFANGYANVRISGSDAADTLDFSNTVLSGITKISGGAGDDVIVGSAGNDVISGDAGNDTLSGGAGDDTFLMNSVSRTDTIDGGDGYDTIKATQSSSVLYWANATGVEAVSGKGYGAVDIAGSNGGDIVDLSTIALSGIRQIDGRDGDDTIIGSSGDDRIVGGNGGDDLTGGAGNDVFDFNTIGQSKVGRADVISDFVAGSDRIDLSTIDASTAVAGNQSFSFVGEDAFTGVAGQLRIDTSQAGKTVIYADVNGNMVADFQIELIGVHQFTSSDFGL